MRSKNNFTPRIAWSMLVCLIVCAAILASGSGAKSDGILNLMKLDVASAASPGEQSFVSKLSLPANDLVVDPTNQKIYASVPSSGGSIGNSIVPINPTDATLGSAVPVGSEPNKMAISDNDQFIYVALGGATKVRRFDVATQTAGLEIPIGTDSFNGPLFPLDLAVQPGSPNTIAVLRTSGLAIYDDAVQRTSTSGASSTNASLAFSPTNMARLYALSSQSLNRFNVTANGVSGINNLTVNASGAAKIDNGRLFTSSGHVLDPETGSLQGTFTGVSSNGATTAFVPDSTVGRVFFLTAPFSSGSFTVTLRVYDQTTFVPLGTLVIPDVLGTPTEMVRWGTNGLAFCTTGGNVVIIQSTLVSAQGPVPSPTPTPTPSPTPTPIPTPIDGELRQVALATNDLVAAANSQTIFASVPSSAGLNGNSVTPINAVTAAVEQSVFIGSEPNKLAMSNDGTSIYAGLDGANAVRRFDATTRTAGLQFSLGADPFFGPFRAEDLAVAPGQPNVLAVSRLRPGVSPRHGGVAIFDNGVQRTTTTPDHTGSNVIEFSNSPEILYGQNTETTEFGFRKMAVASCGCVTLAVSQNLLSGFGGDFKTDDGLVFATGGRVIDPETRTVVGTFVVRSPNSFGSNAILVAPDAKAGRVYFIVDESGSTFLRVFDIKTFLKIGELRLPGVSGMLSSLIRWGSNGLAFRSSSQVFLLQNALIGVLDPNFVPAPQPPSPTANSSVQVTSFNGNPGGVAINITGSFTTSGATNATGNFTITGIPPCGSYTITPTKTNYVFSPSSTTVTNPTSSQANNFSATLKTISFSQTATSQGEQVAKIFLNVTRNISTDPATVSYQTVSGTASDRSDFTPAVGTLQFAANESSKTITILTTDDVFVEGPEQFTVNLLNPTGAEIVPATSTITVTINDNDSVPNAANPLSNAQFFVRQHYQDFLNRAAADDPAGFNFWVNEITSCQTVADPVQRANCFAVKRINVSAAFFLSIEFQQTGYLVHRLYTSSFPESVARPRGLPRLAEFQRDTQEIGRGVVVGTAGWEQKLEQNKQAFVLSWVDRPEFVTEHPLSQTAAQFVDSLFLNNATTPTANERSTAIAAFGSGDATGRAAALRSVAESPSVFNKQYNSAFVLMQYFGYLRRNPDDAPDANFDGYQFWLNKLNQFGNFVDAELVKAFLLSTEYQVRFGPSNFDISQ